MIDDHNYEVELQKANYTLMRQCISDVRTSQKVSLWGEDKLREYINFVQKVFEPVVTVEAERLLQAYYQYLRVNPRVAKERKSVRMLESLIRLAEAHARLLMKSEATVFDAISVIILMESASPTCLFGAEPTPPVNFQDEQDYIEQRDGIMFRLGLNPDEFTEDCQKRELAKKSRSPSPIKRIEMSMFLGEGARNFDLSVTSQYNLDDSRSLISGLNHSVISKTKTSRKPTL